MPLTLPAVLIATLAAPALAGAPPCTASLTDDGRRMFEAVAPAVRADTDIEKAMRSRLRRLVMSGDLDRYTARTNGEAVAACLAELKSAETADSGTASEH